MRDADAGIQDVAVDALTGAVDEVVVPVVVDRSRKFGAGGDDLESVPSIRHRVLGVSLHVPGRRLQIRLLHRLECRMREAGLAVRLDKQDSGILPNRVHEG